MIGGNGSANVNKWYTTWLAIVVLGTGIILGLFLTNMKTMVDFATKVAFIPSPVIAILNYLVINGKTIPEQYRQRKLLKIVSWIGMLYLVGFSIYFVCLSSYN
jgi:Mn2+/Fe2+ NRAMP family transporter